MRVYYNEEKEVSVMKGRLFEWIVAPLMLLCIAIYEIFATWDDSRIVATFFIFGAIAACWLLLYGIRRFMIVLRYKKKKANTQ